MSKLFWKATLAFVALPGIVAFAVPLLLFETNVPHSPAWAIGLVPLLGGIALLLTWHPWMTVRLSKRA